MRGITRNIIIWCGLALCLASFVAGCSKSDDQPAGTTTNPALAAPATGSAKPSGGMIAAPTAMPAPPGVQTGNFAGGKK